MPLAFPSWSGLGVGSSCLLPLAFPSNSFEGGHDRLVLLKYPGRSAFTSIFIFESTNRDRQYRYISPGTRSHTANWF
ncbi:MAG: hypothetical protein F6K56_29430 [Moorea sp. SIO3G5]|nr:hypothetical protein [Moorena sp. SIO3G5]